MTETDAQHATAADAGGFHPDWLIVLTMPNTGSTALSGLLMTAPGATSINNLVEGQWIVPEMSNPSLCWRPDLRIDYARARGIWLEAARARCSLPAGSGMVPLVIDKSPSSLIRHRAIIGMLSGMRVYTAILTRNPFATCASWHKRYQPERVRGMWGLPIKPDADEATYFAALAELWVSRLRLLDQARDEGAHWIRYEDFSESPARAFSALAQAVPRMAEANPEAQVVVKDYRRQGVTNMNDRQVKRMSDRANDAIAEALLAHTPLLARYGYATEPPTQTG